MSLMDQIMGAPEELLPQAPGNADLEAIASLAHQQLEAEGVVARLSLELEEANKKLKHLSEQALPDAMAAVGMSEFKLVDGSKITIKDDVAASIRADCINQAVHWLDEKGLGDVVKDDITIKFGRDEKDKASELARELEAQGYNAVEKLSVHSATLKSLVKEQLALGVEFPAEYFSVYSYKKAAIKRPKGV